LLNSEFSGLNSEFEQRNRQGASEQGIWSQKRKESLTFPVPRFLNTLPVGGLLCSIAADRHTAPPSRMASGSIDEEKRAGRPLASFHVGESF